MKSKKTEGGFNFAVLAAQLEKAKRGAGFDSFTFREIAAVLSTALHFKPEVPRRERQRLTWEACVSAKAGGTITDKSLLGAFHRGQEEFLKSPACDFVFVTTISLPISRGQYRRAIHAGSAVITDNLPPKYLAARASEMNYIPESDQCPPDHKFIRMPVSARSAHEAVDLALDRIDLIRASWNFLLNEKTISQISYPTREEPINQILLGRCHSLHQRNGEIALNGHFRRTRESLPSRTKAIAPSEWLRARKRHRSTVMRLRHHPYPEILRNGLVRYVRSLDLIDEESCFRKLWSLVEYLTGTGHGSYDMTIQRIQFLLKEYGWERQVLENIRLQRNRSVHEDDSPEEVETLIWQMKHYVERLLRFHFAVGRDFPTFEEAVRFLDLPPDKSVLIRKLRLYRKALGFRSGRV